MLFDYITCLCIRIHTELNTIPSTRKPYVLSLIYFIVYIHYWWLNGVTHFIKIFLFIFALPYIHKYILSLEAYKIKSNNWFSRGKILLWRFLNISTSSSFYSRNAIHLFVTLDTQSSQVTQYDTM